MGTPGSTRGSKTQSDLPSRQKCNNCKLVCQGFPRYACPMRGCFCVLGPLILWGNGVCVEAGTEGSVEDARNVCLSLLVNTGM